jgi:hypothetical protein
LMQDRSRERAPWDHPGGKKPSAGRPTTEVTEGCFVLVG